MSLAHDLGTEERPAPRPPAWLIVLPQAAAPWGFSRARGEGDRHHHSAVAPLRPPPPHSISLYAFSKHIVSDQHNPFPCNHQVLDTVWPFLRAPATSRAKIAGIGAFLLDLVRKTDLPSCSDLKNSSLICYLVTLQPWHPSTVLVGCSSSKRPFTYLLTYPVVPEPPLPATLRPRSCTTRRGQLLPLPGEQGRVPALMASACMHNFLRMVLEAAQSSWPRGYQNFIWFGITELLSFQAIIPLSQNTF